MTTSTLVSWGTSGAAVAAALRAILMARSAVQKLTAHTDRMKTGTPFEPSELEMIGHAARSVAKDFLQDLAEEQGQPYVQRASQASMGTQPGQVARSCPVCGPCVPEHDHTPE